MMAARSRFQNNSNEWDSMREEFNNSTYDAQYPDEETSGGVQLDHCRLYITNVPPVLNEEGLRAAFSKYGTLTEVHVSKDPTKKYALVRFETPGEAKLAMTKLNRTEPLRLNINIAHKTKAKHQENRNADRDREHGGRKSAKADTASVGSRGRTRKNIDLSNGDNDMEDEIGGNEFELAPMDPDLELELEQIKLKQLELQEEQVRCKQRLLLLKTSKRASNLNSSINRCILPDGRIVVRNISERNLESRDGDTSFGAGAGDSRVASRACVSCGADADSFCSRCGVTPYCSARCQRRDWTARHQAVCHNLAKLATGREHGRDHQEETDTAEPSIPPPAPLRRPHSPKSRQEARQERQDDSFDRQNNKISTAPGTTKQPQRNNNLANNRGGRGYNNNNNNRDNNINNRDNNNRRPYERRPQPKQEVEEVWGNKTQEPDEVKQVKAQPIEPKPVAEHKPVAEPKPVAESKPVAAASVANVSSRNAANFKRPGEVSDVTPAKKFAPKNYVIELLPIGDTALLSVDNVTSSCATNKPGYVCLSMHDKFEVDYQALCETYVVDCEADPNNFVPSPGDLFSYLSPEDGGWYRARCLGKDTAALIDSSKTIKLTKSDATKRLTGRYEEMPEFCCVLDANDVKVGDNLKCTLIAKTANGYKVSLEHIETGAPVGEGAVTRWVPHVEYPQASAAFAPQTPQTPQIPEVPRPPLTNNSRVHLVDLTGLDRAFVRPAGADAVREFDQVLQDVYLYATKASPLSQPPKKGDTVIGKYTDGLFYRALVKRTNVAQNKYLLEYIDYGNIEIAKLENLYPCPAEYDLQRKPTLASMAALTVSCGNSLAARAAEYVDKLKDANDELVLTLPSGDKTAPSGSSVTLTMLKTNESLNKKLEQLCTPDWKKLEHEGVDVVELKKLMYEHLTYLELPSGGCEVDVLDVSVLHEGTVSGHQRGLKEEAVLKQLTDRMAEYCDSELGREPYLPALEELCIAKCPPYPQWFRAVVVEHTAGESEARVLYIDYGNLETVPVNLLRKMLPEFAAQPALANLLEIRDFPKDPTDEMLMRAVTHMQMTEEGRGVLKVTRCQRQEPGLYSVDAPDLIRAMGVSTSIK
ncbi:uncharacterized protein LOC106139600 isoform X3 [Amyelois transitella]|uniref:uncharacterized protein LOC106139600 isoform X3 n=1 Tax=Amyelois transitella TaxID=680683 RepID=UPI00298FCE8B|nr:uncharacterized protein LOC106139600 isoform X3 [Amyelois transitella]